MKTCFHIGLLALLTSCGSLHRGEKYVPANPLPVRFGDPYILLASDGRYYLYGTGGGIRDGCGAYSSVDLVHWDRIGQVYRGNTPCCWAVSSFWAPEVYEVKGKYYLFFSANWRYNPSEDLENFRIGVAVADSPAGPFKDLTGYPLFDPGYPVIDANLLLEQDKAYLYYSRVCYEHPVESDIARWARTKGIFSEIEESWIYGIELSDGLDTVIGDPVLLLRPPKEKQGRDFGWESRSVTAREVNRRWTEGSFIFKKRDTYYIMYSANYFGGEHYAVGYATSDSPLGHFSKARQNPILEKKRVKDILVSGTGHNSVTWSPDGKHAYCVYHGRTSETGMERLVFIDALKITPTGKLRIRGPTIDPEAL